jgi:hypothetical protein
MFPWPKLDTTIMGIQIYINATMAQQQRNTVFCSFHAKIV